MADSTLSIKLTDTTNCTVTMSTQSFPEAQAFIQGCQKSGGFFDDNKVYHPMTAVLTISIS